MALAASALCLLAVPAWAQSGSSGSSPGHATTAPNAADGTSEGGNLSHRLNQTGGVLHPQSHVDPGMAKPAPPTGNMPVMPPPGSPGGDPGVQPK